MQLLSNIIFIINYIHTRTIWTIINYKNVIAKRIKRTYNIAQHTDKKEDHNFGELR